MGRRSLIIAVVCAIAAAALAFGALFASKSVADPASTHPFRTAVYLDGPEDFDADASRALDRVVASGATIVRVTLNWYEVAPTTEPTSWNPADPSDPNYNWSKYDEVIRQAAAHHLDVLLTFLAAPSWAQTSPPDPPPGSHLPKISDFSAFVTAAAKRYSGTFGGLPRVRYWQAWNEPNLSPYLEPQLVNRKPVAAYAYRRMLNAFYTAVKAVSSDNTVVAAGLAPFRDVTGNVMLQNTDWGPLSFMRALLCIGRNLKPVCGTKVSFDVWAQHPYTSGDPTHHAQLPNDVSLGDIPKVQAILAAAEAAGHVRSDGVPGFWVTEFSWDTNPPDRYAVPAALAARWVAQAEYVLWKDGVDVLTWLELRDGTAQDGIQSGLYYRGSTFAADRRKPLFEAFRFPVVGFRAGGQVNVWGHTPAGKPGRVVVEQYVGSRWTPLGSLTTDHYGIFQKTYGNLRGTAIRARLDTGEKSRAFSLKAVPDHFYNPFGGPVSLESKPKPKAKGR